MGEEAGAGAGAEDIQKQLRKFEQQRADDLETLRVEIQAGHAAVRAEFQAGQAAMREEIARLDLEIAAVRARMPEAIARELGSCLRSMAAELEAVLEPQQLRQVMDIAQRCVFAPTCCAQG
jgi:hypothetical protein